jgi:small subunit ribosomal protein S6
VNEYELMAVLHPRLTADETEGAIEFLRGQVTSNGGEIIDVDNWGRRRLAYPVDANYEGTYVLTTLRLPPEGTRPLESQLLLSEDVIRHLLIRGIIPYEGEDPRQSQVRPGASAGPADAPPEPAPSAEAAEAPAEADEEAADAAETAAPTAEAAESAEAAVAEETAPAGDAEAEASDAAEDEQPAAE